MFTSVAELEANITRVPVASCRGLSGPTAAQVATERKEQKERNTTHLTTFARGLLEMWGGYVLHYIHSS
jgi:hypothetical protein